jgi:hypothetical protein
VRPDSKTVAEKLLLRGLPGVCVATKRCPA